MKQILVLIFSVALTSQLYAQAKQFNHAGERRRYTVYLPESYHKHSSKTFPVVYNFHGGGMTMTEQMFYSRMNEAADKYNFIVVYPQGVKQDWNVGFDMSYTKGIDDVGFINALHSRLKKELRMDSIRVYATGLSRGGFFCHRLAVELPEIFSAIASVGGPLPDSVAFFHKKKLPVSMMMIHGTADSIVKYDGKKDAYASAKKTFDYWKVHNGIQSAGNKEYIDRNRKDSTS